MAILFALITAVAYGFDFYLVRKGLMDTPYPLWAAFITLTVNLTFFVIFSSLWVPSSLLKLNLVYLFIIAGVLAPGLARALSYTGLETLGMAVCVPIINAESLFSVVLAVLFLDEPMNLPIGTGFVCVVSGLVLLGYESGKRDGSSSSKKIRYRYLIFPITASLCYGVSLFFRKLGLNVVGAPILGAMVTSGASWCMITSFLLTTGSVRHVTQIRRQSLLYFLMGGCATCIAWFSLFHALNLGKVVIITPIAGSYPLVTLFLSYLFLRDVERINLKIVLATFLIVGGIVLLCLVK
jgi:DME family drug/metabolite transporter